jgi:hypothetical protein
LSSPDKRKFIRFYPIRIDSLWDKKKLDLVSSEKNPTLEEVKLARFK